MVGSARSRLLAVLDDLGSTLLDLVRGDIESARDVSGMSIHDPASGIPVPAGAIVLGVGLTSPSDLAEAVTGLDEQAASALVVRSPVVIDANLEAAIDASGIVVLGLNGGASWAQLASLLTTELSRPGQVGADTVGGVITGDLFAVANAVSALIDAPITIEDRSARVLAFSGGQDKADAARVATILGRQVPESALRQMEERAVYSLLNRTPGPVYVEPLTTPAGETALPRVAISVRAGDEILGSIWAMVDGELTPHQLQALSDAAKFVSLHLLRHRAGADIERRLRTDLVGALLEGGDGAKKALRGLGLEGRECVVLALVRTAGMTNDIEPATTARLVQELQRTRDALALHLAAFHPKSAVAILGDTVYAICPVSPGSDDPTGDVLRAARDFLQRAHCPGQIGVGTVGSDDAGIVRSRTAADRIVRVLMMHDEPRAATLSEVYLEALLIDLNEVIAAQDDVHVGPISRLHEYDRTHGADLAATLRYWLEAFGDVPSAAARAAVHPNTFRYRLHRIADVGQIDLHRPDERLLAMLELRLADFRANGPRPGPRTVPRRGGTPPAIPAPRHHGGDGGSASQR